ncbi:MAG: acetyl-CoA carboxylase biotin carboxyl carrier protein [Bacteroidetes bacterium]|nr:acetyl-CoA carboxylase biotin carboxyl carrier protein [Bacteroidota bacterium]MCY4205755.1 acetyl-CoA carboxylase biotin carboxyl carrier protein [Bacteroidota bacterium]
MPKLFSKTWSQEDFDRIQKLISMAAESDASEVEIEADGVRVVVRKQVLSTGHVAPPPPVTIMSGGVSPATVIDPQQPIESESGEESAPVNGTPILSPTPGTFYSKPSPDADPFVQVGDRIQKGQIVCIIEAMKLMNEVEAETTGTVQEILLNDGDAVEYDQPLMIIEPA